MKKSRRRRWDSPEELIAAWARLSSMSAPPLGARPRRARSPVPRLARASLAMVVGVMVAGALVYAYPLGVTRPNASIPIGTSSTGAAPTANSETSARPSSQASPTASVRGTVAPSLPPQRDVDVVLYLQAEAALERWSELVEAAPPDAVVFVGELTRGGGWRGRGANDRKSAFLAGRIETAVELPAEPPPPGRVVWEDGTTAIVLLFSAAEALEDLVRHGQDDSCSTCPRLTVTGAELVRGEAETSRGRATVPLWLFRFARADEPMTPITYVAVKDRIVAGEEQPWDPYGENPIGPAIHGAYGSATDTELTVTFVGSPWTGEDPCGADYTAEAVESELAVVVIVRGHSRRSPDATPRPCIALGAQRTAVVELDAPLGDRTALEVQFGTPVAVHSGDPPASEIGR